MQMKLQLQLCRTCLWCCRSQVRLLSQTLANRRSSHYDLLGVKSNASLEEIKSAFFDKSKKLHPDSDPSDPSLHSRFVELNEAYRVLSKDRSRKEYDVKMTFRAHRPFTSTSTQSTQSTQSSQSGASAEAEDDNARYWEQFRDPQQMTGEDLQQRRRMSLLVVGCCLLISLLGLGAHFVIYSKLKEVHSNYMDEKDRVITELYNESKEQARINGFEKQLEIMRQKQAKFAEKFK